jgi:hypothetical protein
MTAAVALTDRGADVGDQGIFAASGRLLLSTHALRAFSDAGVQAGPFEIGLWGGLDRLDHSSGALMSALIVELLVTVGLLGALRLAIPGRPEVQLVAGAAAVALQLGSIGYVDGHPAQLAVPLMWVTAAVLVRDRPVLAGLVLGGSAGWEPWGALALPVLLLAGSRRRAVMAGTAAAGAMAALFGPFVLGGSFHMTGYSWLVQPGTLPAVLGGVGKDFGWGWRLGQGTFAMTAGAVVARRWRGAPEDARWAVPLVVVAARLAVDPMTSGYYWLAPQIVGLLGVALLVAHGSRRWDLFLAAYLPLLASLVPGALLAAGVVLVLVVAPPPRRSPRVGRIFHRSLASARMASRYESSPNPMIDPVATAATTEV